MCLLLICIVNLCVFGELFCPKNELSLPRSWAVGLQVRMNACRLVILLTWDLLHVRKWRLHVQNDFNSFSKTPVQNYLIQSAFQRSFWVWQNIEGKDRFLTNYLAGLETDNWLSLQQEPTANICQWQIAFNSQDNFNSINLRENVALTYLHNLLVTLRDVLTNFAWLALHA